MKRTASLLLSLLLLCASVLPAAAAETEVPPVTTAAQILQNQKDGVISALKTVEEGGVYKGDPELVRDFYRRGVRMSTLTWNFEK